MKTWIIATPTGRVMCTNGDFRQPRELICHGQVILNRRGPYAVAHELYDFLSQPGINLVRIRNMNFQIFSVNFPFSKISTADLTTPVFTIALTAKNQLQVKEIATGEIKRSWKIKETPASAMYF